VAIEIPSLAADRLPHPDWSPAAALARLGLGAGRLLAALEGTSAPAGLLEALRALPAGADVEVLMAPDRGVVQVLIEGRRIPLAGAARDAVLSLLGDAAAGAPGGSPAAAQARPDAFLAARVADVQAQVQESRAHAADPPALVEDPVDPEPAVVLPTPLVDGRGADATALGLERAVAASGLFLEAHVAQWLRGERSLAQVRDEADALRTATPQGGAGATQEDRAARQVDALQRQGLRLEAQAWAGQPLQLEIARDPERQGGGPADAQGNSVFEATLRLHLPRVGLLRARIRVLHETVGLQIAGENVPLLAGDARGLAEAFSARGFTVAALEIAPLDAAGREAWR